MDDEEQVQVTDDQVWQDIFNRFGGAIGQVPVVPSGMERPQPDLEFMRQFNQQEPPPWPQKMGQYGQPMTEDVPQDMPQREPIQYAPPPRQGPPPLPTNDFMRQFGNQQIQPSMPSSPGPRGDDPYGAAVTGPQQIENIQPRPNYSGPQVDAWRQSVLDDFNNGRLSEQAVQQAINAGIIQHQPTRYPDGSVEMNLGPRVPMTPLEIAQQRLERDVSRGTPEERRAALHTYEQARLEDIRLGLRERERMGRMRDAIASVRSDPNLSRQEQQALITEIQSGLNPLMNRNLEERNLASRVARRNMEQEMDHRGELHLREQQWHARGLVGNTRIWRDPVTGLPATVFVGPNGVPTLANFAQQEEHTRLMNEALSRQGQEGLDPRVVQQLHMNVMNEVDRISGPNSNIADEAARRFPTAGTAIGSPERARVVANQSQFVADFRQREVDRRMRETMGFIDQYARPGATRQSREAPQMPIGTSPTTGAAGGLAGLGGQALTQPNAGSNPPPNPMQENIDAAIQAARGGRRGWQAILPGQTEREAEQARAMTREANIATILERRPNWTRDHAIRWLNTPDAQRHYTPFSNQWIHRLLGIQNSGTAGMPRNPPEE